MASVTWGQPFTSLSLFSYFYNENNHTFFITLQ